MSIDPNRKGACTVVAVPPAILQALEQGVISSVNLTENLAIDQARLLQAVFPEAAQAQPSVVASLAQLGIVQRMARVGQLLLAHYGLAAVEQCQAHPSDTVRGWAGFILGALPEWTLAQRLQQMRPLADDAHFGVREWAWLALRPVISHELTNSIELLTPWTLSSSERLRRFACEALRPRGVWCAHITALKHQPEWALPILESLRADRAAYVQLSVGNWLNDAAKTQPDWVRQLCLRWREQSPVPATTIICQRALRNLL